MILTRLSSENDNMFSTARGLYEKSFPLHEQRQIDSQKEILKCEEYHFDLIHDEDRFIGILLSWETRNFIYVEHFCITPEIRNKGYGQKTLDLLNSKGKTVILEIDPPTDEIALKRKSFYERAGYQANAMRHIHPPYDRRNTGHALTVMSYPHLLSRDEYDKFDLYLKNQVMKTEQR